MSAPVDGAPDGSADLLPLLDWVSRQAEAVDLELACVEHPDPGRGPRGPSVVVLPGCLADIAPHVLLELLVVGADSVTAAIGGCAAAEVVRDRYRPLIALLDQLGHQDRLRLRGTSGRSRRRPVLSATSMPVSRRQLFLLPEAERRPLPETAATEHQRLLTALRGLVGAGVDAAEATVPVPDGPALRLRSTGCTACGVCVQTCPERALELEVASLDDDAAGTARPGDDTTLWMQPAACSGCRACVDACPPRALSEHGTLDWDVLLDDGWEDLETLRTVVCRRCGGRFPAGGSALCPVCAFRSAQPFGTTLPPEVLARLGPEVAGRFRGRPDPR